MYGQSLWIEYTKCYQKNGSAALRSGQFQYGHIHRFYHFSCTFHIHCSISSCIRFVLWDILLPRLFIFLGFWYIWLGLSLVPHISLVSVYMVRCVGHDLHTAIGQFYTVLSQEQENRFCQSNTVQGNYNCNQPRKLIYDMKKYEESSLAK